MVSCVARNGGRQIAGGRFKQGKRWSIRDVREAVNRPQTLAAGPLTADAADFACEDEWMELRASLARLIFMAVAQATIIVALAVHAQLTRADDRVVELAGRTMGTTYHLKYWGDGESMPVEVHRQVEELLARFDKQMSTYRDDSEISRFNQAKADAWFPVSKETAYVVAKSIEFGQMTDGALDITVAPVLALWGIGGGARRTEAASPPDEARLEQAMKLVGVEQLRVRTDPPALWKNADAVEIDLSAIAPGYAVDLVTELLESLGFDNSLVEIGGEVRGAGARPDGSPWRIGVERAGKPDAEFVRVVVLRDLSLTTAGDYRNVHGAENNKYTHIVDPRTGRPLPFRGVSVTVLAETCLEADALDTALLVMGAEAGYEWCVEHDVAALFQTGDEGETVKATPRFEKLLRDGVPSGSKRLGDN
jgi:FAD:protein FMN transferase